MRVEHTHNNIIDITFDPNAEGICLLDFVLVEEGKEKLLAQVVELADDKFDAGLSLAKIKIFYKLNEKNEIVPYDGFTPTRTCKVSICNQKQIEDYINEGHETVELTTNPKTMLPLKIDIDFFNNQPVILADKMDDFNLLSSNLSHILSEYKNVIVFDYTGSLDIEDSARLRAGVDFKLPLDYKTIDNLWEESMKDATIEVQATCDDIFNEVKSYLRTLNDKSIPYNLFLKIIIDEYKKEKNVELWYLKNKLVKYFEEQLFAQDAKDIGLLQSTVENNKITIVDMSNVSASWQKAFCEFILRSVKQDVYLFMRLNDSTSNTEIINLIYGKTKIKVIPSVSYGYKKLPSIAENFNNYIFLSTLNPLRNYGALNPSIWSLDANYAILYGENTKELIFKIQNTTSIDEEIKASKKVRKIPIENFQKQDTSEDESIDFQGIEITPPNRIVVEKSPSSRNVEPYHLELREEAGNNDEDIDMADIQKQLNDENLKEELFSTPKEDDEELEKLTAELNKIESEEDEYEDEVMADKTNEPKKEPSNINEDLEIEFENLFNDEEEQEEENLAEEVAEEDKKEEQENLAEEIIEEEQKEEELQEDEVIEQQEEEFDFLGDNELDFYENTDVSENETEAQDYGEENEEEQDFNFVEDVEQEQVQEEQNNNTEAEQQEQIQEENPAPVSNVTVEDDQFLLVDEPQNEEENEEYYDDQLRAFLEDDGSESEADVYEVQPSPEAQPSQQAQKKYVAQSNQDFASSKKSSFKVGEVVTHQKYGIGKVLEVIEYSNRTLLQLEFADIGKRLLDPDIAHIKHLSDK